MSHMSVLGACWAQAYFEEMLFLEEKPRMRKVQLEGKATRARKACKACMQGNLTTLGLGFL
jgi:hypothetical protein